MNKNKRKETIEAFKCRIDRYNRLQGLTQKDGEVKKDKQDKED